MNYRSIRPNNVKNNTLKIINKAYKRLKIFYFSWGFNVIDYPLGNIIVNAAYYFLVWI